MDYHGKHNRALEIGLRRMGASCPTVTWNGSPVPVQAGTARRRKDMAAGGWAFDCDFVFHAVLAAFGETAPESNDVVEYEANQYRVRSVTILPGGTVAVFQCVDWTAGA